VLETVDAMHLAQRPLAELSGGERQRLLLAQCLFSAHELNPLLNAIDRVLYLGNGRAALGTVDEVITAPTLSKLYGAPIDVMRVHGRIFVMSGGVVAPHLPGAHDV
jgi:zinc/manganese transport system ATP-binding protein